MPDVTTDYLDLEYIKIALQVKSENLRHDEVLRGMIFTANSEVDSQLKPFLGDSPIEVESSIYVQAKRAAARYVMSLWYESNNQLPRATHSEEIYDKKIKNLIAAIKAERTDRTKTVFTPGGKPLDRTYQSGNVDEYLVRAFE